MRSLSATRIEGGLFGPDLFDELIAGDLPGQRPADFGLDAKRGLTDEAAAAFQEARQLWGIFQRRLARVPEADLATSLTRDAWMIPFLGLLGYELAFNSRAIDIDGESFAISHRAGELDLAPPVHIVGSRQELGRVPASGRPRLAPHSLVQEFLNRSEHVWGIVTNGRTLRLLRDTTFVRRQAYVEFDLEAIFEEQKFDDFAVLFRLLHRTRLPRGIDDSATCLLEQYYEHAVEQGGRVREHLREGVEDCLKELANGFLRHPANESLRLQVRASDGAVARLSGEDVYRQLLRLVYRFLFLLVSEERGLVSRDPVYREHYGIARLRKLVDSRAAHTGDDDLWQSLRVLWRVLADDDLAKLLGVAPLNGELFEPVTLDGCTISNRDLLNAFWRLSWYRDGDAPPRRVNYAALDVEELGSVYESLLEFHPVIDPQGPSFDLLAGSERKTTGSYYTPPELVNELIQSALDPVIEARLSAATANQRERALLSIRVCDPACGSGHFLLAAARRLGKSLARVRTGEDEPAPERLRESTRDVIAHCIYGVDRNPLAVDLCRVALWLESHTGGRPLTFLDHRIRCGDSLVGVFDLAVLADGIPDKAFEPLEGDDRAVARVAARQNKSEREGHSRSLFGSDGPGPEMLDGLSRAGRELDAIDDDSPAAVRRKKHQFEAAHADRNWLRQKQACDLWTAAFFQQLQPGRLLITSGQLAEHLGGGGIDSRLIAEAEVLSDRGRFFHWPLEFPEVMADGGFDAVLSNPPWERVKLHEQEFFAVRDPIVATAPTKAARSRLIEELLTENPTLSVEFREAQRLATGVGQFLRHSGRYPLAGRGDINTYAVFSELAADSPNPRGRAGVIVPTGIATDDTTKLFFGSIVRARRLVELVGFENEDRIFPAVHHAFKFCKLIIGERAGQQEASRIAFFIRRFSELNDTNRYFLLQPDDFILLNPNTGNCPVFRTRADAELTKAIYRRVPTLWTEGTDHRAESNQWRLSFSRLFDMSTDSHHFKTAPDLLGADYRLEGNVFVSAYDRYLPLYEAKMVHQFDHRFSTYEGATDSQLNVGILPQATDEQKRDPFFVVQPRYWVREEVVESAVPKYPEPLAQALGLGANGVRAMRQVLLYWIAGYYLQIGEVDIARERIGAAVSVTDSMVSAFTRLLTADQIASGLNSDFPLEAQDVARIEALIASRTDPTGLADELINRFTPKWLIGWRDITNSTNERTLIAGVVPRVAVGNSFPLALVAGHSPEGRLCFLANANSLVVDYIARQKVGGTHINYFYLKQFPLLSPQSMAEPVPGLGSTLVAWVGWRALRLVFSSEDLAPLAEDYGSRGRPFRWEPEDRFEIRCELDAAFFHCYLTPSPVGEWTRAALARGCVADETEEQLAALREHFESPRHAVSHILDQFPIVRAKDEAEHGTFRTKDRILEIYDAMQAAMRQGTTYKSRFDA